MKWYQLFKTDKFTSVLLSLVFLLLFSSCSRTKTTFYPDGKISSEISVFMGKYDGKAVWYYKNGSKQQECYYSNDLLHGQSARWYYNGRLQRTDNYSYGLKTGESVAWDENGNKLSAVNWINDTLNGSFREWYSNGQLRVNGSFLKGRFHGKWTYYNYYGIEAGSGNFEHGNGKLVSFYMNGRIRRVVDYYNGVKHGEDVTLRLDGSIESITNY